MRLRHSSINHSAVQDNSDCPRIISNPLMACFAFLKNASQPFFAGGLFFNRMQTKRDWCLTPWLNALICLVSIAAISPNSPPHLFAAAAG